MSTPSEIVSNGIPAVDVNDVDAEKAARKAAHEAAMLQTGQMNLRAMRSFGRPDPANRLGLR